MGEAHGLVRGQDDAGDVGVLRVAFELPVDVHLGVLAADLHLHHDSINHEVGYVLVAEAALSFDVRVARAKDIPCIGLQSLLA